MRTAPLSIIKDHLEKNTMRCRSNKAEAAAALPLILLTAAIGKSSGRGRKWCANFVDNRSIFVMKALPTLRTLVYRVFESNRD